MIIPVAQSKILENLGVKTIVVHGIALAASIFVMSAVASPEQNGRMSVVDLSKRPTISSNVGDGNRRAFKLVEFGEISDPALSGRVYSDEAGRIKAIENLPHHFLTGRASILDKGKFSNEFDVCMINHAQNEAVSDDGQFYLFYNDSPTLYKRQYVDFFTRSHEAEHCFFMVKFPQKYAQPERFEYDHIEGTAYQRYNNYVLSFKEVSADLGATLDYMRQTGTNDLYTQFIRPWRVSAVGVSNHRTAWAMDVILKDIDPVSIQKKSADEIPDLVEGLMNKHFLDASGSYFPDALPLGPAKLSHETPAARALYDEVRADMYMSGRLHGHEDALVTRLKADIHQSVSAQISSYAVNQSPEAVGLAMRMYGSLANQYGLERLTFTTKAEAPKEPRVLKNFVDPYLKLMLTP